MIAAFGAEGRAVLRAPTPADLPFVLDTWVRSQRSAPQWKAVDVVTYKREFLALVTSVIKRAGTQVVIACDEEAQDNIYGFVVWSAEPRAIHMVYVRGFLRSMGLGKLLATVAHPELRQEPVTVTATAAPITTTKGKPPVTFGELASKFRLSYNPFTILRAP